MAEPLFEAVPNISEGRDRERISRILEDVRSVPGVRVLDLHSDPDHNRSVITMAGQEEPIVEAAVTLARTCAEEIDLSVQAGVHPRMGSLDVLPFVPLEDSTLEDAARLAYVAGEKIGALGYAVYLYEAAATASRQTQPGRRPPRRVRGSSQNASPTPTGLRTTARLRYLPVWEPSPSAPGLSSSPSTLTSTLPT